MPDTDPKQKPAVEIIPQARSGQDFFQVQTEFAATAARILKIPYEQAMTQYTNLFNFIASDDREIENIEKVWDEFVKESGQAVQEGNMAGVARIAYEKYNRPIKHQESRDTEEEFGCFSYHIQFPHKEGTASRVQVHFLNRDSEGGGPLSQAKLATRKKELVAMFRKIREKHPSEDFVVTGSSWLYNIPQYRELFPKQYRESLNDPANVAPTKTYLQNLGLWGQFLKADGTTNMELWSEFRKRLELATTEEGLLESFKVKVLTPKAPISAFYEMLDGKTDEQ